MKREPSLEKILERRELSSIEVNEDEQALEDLREAKKRDSAQKDEKNN